MNKRQLGNTDLHISEVGLGCMNLGTNEQNAKGIIHEAINAGINYIDTADLYDYGENEKLVGKALKGKRQDTIVATKGGNHFEPGQDGWYWDPSKKYLKEAIKNSLLRLGLDDVDLYQLHGGTIEDPIDEVIETFEELQQEGLIRYFGLSSIRPNVIKSYVDQTTVTSNMMQYSLLDRRPEEELLDYLDSNQVSVLVRGALGKGMLTSKGIEQWEKKGSNGFLEYDQNELKQVIEKLQVLAQEANTTPQSIAMHYCLSHPGVSSLILGASRPEQIQHNIKAYYDAPNDEAIVKEVSNMTKEQIYEQHRV
ncbi:aryl-alcohol dehydrogenase-like predicted oxidoreductase [Alkalibacillus filiformis]|uniref:Aryl-alcohol dehydrogenase-like predicted oxidoreductase n=1 Tax=Alkalibacillus filiformis TaxID=200990 RepID=A0ABU0DRH4_9BACI|nr:aldo/keto reductase [Alkalibacillus filiformis]MDQ0350921.1 aryl-alcohol dehydrogenase-like predicted oxidoreductase [Alkalibacillus filiformis]